ncbi:MAG: hypothetical protein KGL39_23190 [Patescibacteria group bacterium]|nr:hypothetical protein [Patescibacteria group bacterium]
MSGVSKQQPHKAWQWLMDHAGWQTVAEMSRACGLRDTTLHGYVFNGHIPGLKAAKRITEAAGVSLDEFADKLVA